MGWKDKTKTWVSLNLLKEAHPVEVTEFARAKGIDSEPAFSWWVPHVVRKREVILATIKSRLRITTHKFGIEIPVSIKDTERIYLKNGNSFLRNAISLEVHNVGVAFEVLEKN